MIIIQAIGAPCTGKSTFLKRFIAENPQWSLYDIADFRDVATWLLAENKMLNKMKAEKPDYVILESAQGVHDVCSFNVLFKCDMKTLCERHDKRGIELTDDLLEYYSLILSVGVKPEVTIDTTGSYEHLSAKFCKAIEMSRSYSVDREASIRRKT
jgi:hypothetical protein